MQSFYAYANYHFFCIGFTRERPLENGIYLIHVYAYSYEFNEHAQLSSETGSSFKSYLHIPPYFVFADSGGLVKYMQIIWLVQTFPWRLCAKSLLQM